MSSIQSAIQTNRGKSTAIERDILTTTLPTASKSSRKRCRTSVRFRSASGSAAVRAAKPPKQNGISHFIEHMLFKGTANRSAEDIARSVDSIGGNLDAFTAKEMVCFNTKVLDEHLPHRLGRAGRPGAEPRCSAKKISRRKRASFSKKSRWTPIAPIIWSTRSSPRISGKTTPLGKPILGTRETVKRFDRAIVQDYYRSVYTPANMLITAAGNLTHERLVDLARERFESLQHRRARAAADRSRPRTRASRCKSKKDLEQVHVCLGVPSYPIPHEDRFACYVLNTMLGGGMSSRLFQNIRERQGLAYAVFSELNPYSDTGCLSVYAGTSLESAKQVVESVLQGIHGPEAETRARRRSAPRQGSSERFADAESGIDLQPDVEPGAAGDVLPAASSRWTSWWRASRR